MTRRKLPNGIDPSGTYFKTPDFNPRHEKCADKWRRGRQYQIANWWFEIVDVSPGSLVMKPVAPLTGHIRRKSDHRRVIVEHAPPNHGLCLRCVLFESDPPFAATALDGLCDGHRT